MTNRNGHHWIRDTKRRLIYERDGWRCVWCFVSLFGPHIMKGDRTLDHVMPRSYGGTNDATNLVTSCYTCNTMRGDLSAPEFAKATAHRVAARRGGMSLAEIEEIAFEILDRVRDWTHRDLPIPGKKSA